jgi:hypothetical protein
MLPNGSPIPTLSGKSVAERLADQISPTADFDLLLSKCVESDFCWLDAFVSARGLDFAASFLRKKAALSSLCVSLLASFALQPRLLESDSSMGAVLFPLRLDCESVEQRQLSLECLGVVVAGNRFVVIGFFFDPGHVFFFSRERALSWLRFVQRLCRESALLGRLAELLRGEDVATLGGVVNVLLAWLGHGDTQQQNASRRELLLLGVHEECRRMARHEMLGPAMRLLLGQIRAATTSEDNVTSVVVGEKLVTLSHKETVEQLEQRLGGRLLFAGCVPQSGVFCRPSLVLHGTLLRCERWPVPWCFCITGPSITTEASCRIDSRMTGEKALAYVATFHLEEWSEHRLKVKGGIWVDPKRTLAQQCRDGDVLELKVPGTVRVELAGGDTREMPLNLSMTVGELLESVGRVEHGVWMRVAGERDQKKQKTWLEKEVTLGESGVDSMYVLRCEARPRKLCVVREEGGVIDMDVMEHDLVSEVVARAAAGAKDRRLFFSGRDCALFGWATLAQQNVPAGTLLSLKPFVVPEIYATSLVGPFVNDDPHLADDLHWEKSGDGLQLLEAASLPSLIGLMTGGGSVQHIQMILLTHASFTSSAQLLRLLLQRGRCQDHAMVIRVLKVLKQWLDVDRFLPGVVVESMVAFLECDVPVELRGAPLQTLRNALLRWATGRTRMYNIREAPPSPVLLLRGKEATRLRDWDPVELARQITLPVFGVYARMEARELFSQPWSSPKTQHKCPNVMEMIAGYNRLAQCVATSIVLGASARRRAKVWGLWIEVGQALQQLQNYHSLSAIVSGMGNASVLRLKYTREALGKKHQRGLQELSELCSMSSSFKNLRDAVMHHGDPPKIPYLGVYLSDFVFIEDGNPNTVTRRRQQGEEVELIFMAKRQLFHKIVSTIQTFQMVPYNFVLVESLQAFLANLQVMDDKQLFAESLLREPRE